MQHTKNINSHVNATRFTNEEKNFIRTAMADPNNEYPTGVPDDIAENTNVKKIVQEIVLNMHDYADSDGTQVDIISWPYLRAMKLTLGTVYRETEVGITGDFDVLTGGVGVYVNKEDKSPWIQKQGSTNYELPLNTTGTMTNAGQVMCIDDDYLGGRCRMLGRSIKVVNEGPETYQSGTVRIWEQPIPTSVGNYSFIEGSIEVENQSDIQVGRFRVETDHLIMPPVPATNQQQQNLRRTKQIGHAKNGVFLIDAVDFNNATTSPIKRDVIWDEGGALKQNTLNNVGEYDWRNENTRQAWICGRLVAAQYLNFIITANPQVTTPTNTVDGQNNRNYYMGNRLRGIRFSGLNTGKDAAPGPAVLRIVVTTYLEQIPSNVDGNMSVLAKKSPDPNPEVLDFLYSLQGRMDFGWEARVNGLGTFTNALVNMLSTKLPENKFTRAFDNSGISQKAKHFMLTKAANVPGLSLGVQAAKYAEAVKNKTPNRKQQKQKLKKNFAKELVTAAIAGPAIGGMIEAWTAASNQVGWLTSPRGLNWASKLWDFHKRNPDYRFAPKLWADVMQARKILLKK